MKLLSTLHNIAAAGASLLKVALLSRRPHPAISRREDAEIVILGNGPSLRAAIDHDMPALMCRERMAVNFAANAPDFSVLRPQYYLLADPHFFSPESTDPNVSRLWSNMAAASWPFTLFVPARYMRHVRSLLACSPHITTLPINLTPGEGYLPIVHALYTLGLAMPRPRNVMIPAIMTAIRLGYKKIWLLGADHSWTRTLDVDEQNHVISVQPHFYKDNASEQRRVNTEYAGLHLHHILRSLTIAFESYHHIARYAACKGVEIINATPGSMIDAFPRAALSLRSNK